MKLSRKMYLGFSIIIVLVIIQTFWSVNDLRVVRDRVDHLANEYAPEVVLADSIRYEIAMAGYHMRSFFASLDQSEYNAGAERLEILDARFADLKALNGRQTQLANLPGYVTALEPSIGKYKELCASINTEAAANRNARVDIDRAFDEFQKSLVAIRGNFADDLKLEEAAYRSDLTGASADSLIRRHRRFLDLAAMEITVGDLMRRLWLAISRRDAAALVDITAGLEETVKTVDAFHRETRLAKNIPLAAAMVKSVDILRGCVASIDRAGTEMARLGSERLAAFNTALDQSSGMAKSGSDGIMGSTAGSLASIRRTLYILLICVTAVAILGVVVALVIVRGIAEQIEVVTEQLQHTGDALDQKTEIIASASDDFANLASTQTASLAQTSSALEQVTTMARQNADNVEETNKETAMVVQQIEKGAGSVRDMGKAMEEINDSSEKIGRIIKTIEEIAFQTNLLALNAAVEAARAGEAGKGFAVVADEVRNLAQRSAQAAQETTTLIQGTVERVHRGGEISRHLGDVFQQIETSAQNVGRLVGEITTAIHEQAQGVDQVSSAMTEIDSATQKNSANADMVRQSTMDIGEETQKMLAVTGGLYAIVHGVEKKKSPRAPRWSPSSDGRSAAGLKLLPAPKGH